MNSSLRILPNILCLLLLGRSVIFSSLREEALCRRHLMRLNSTLPLVTRAPCSRAAPYVSFMGLPIMAGWTTAHVLVSEAGPWPGWLPCCALSSSCWPAGEQGPVLEWLAMWLSSPRACVFPPLGDVVSQGSWLQGLRLVLVYWGIEPGSKAVDCMANGGSRVDTGPLMGWKASSANRLEGRFQNASCRFTLW